MSQLTDAEVYEAIARIIEKYKIFQCEECTTEIREWCADEGIEAILLKLEIDYRGYQKRGNKEEYIVSERRGNEAITRNGKHYGVEIRGLVFDNISPDGRTREEWEADFHCRTGRLIVEPVDRV